MITVGFAAAVGGFAGWRHPQPLLEVGEDGAGGVGLALATAVFFSLAQYCGNGGLENKAFIFEISTLNAST